MVREGESPVFGSSRGGRACPRRANDHGGLDREAGRADRAVLGLRYLGPGMRGVARGMTRPRFWMDSGPYELGPRMTGVGLRLWDLAGALGAQGWDGHLVSDHAGGDP